MSSITPFDSDPLKSLTPGETADWEPGQTLLKNFRVDRILGEGGMGKVYLVFSESGDEFLAVKTLRRSILNRSRSKRQFIRELRTWIDLPVHPNITACRFFRTIRDRMAVFSEYVDGGALSDWIERRKGLSLLTALDIAIQIARGIDAAHRQHVIHQDIKPSNVLLTTSGVAKITDFGLARARHATGLPEDYETGSSQQTILISSGGMTPAFCSPEQAEKGRISRKTDIWSFGLTVLQMFTGRVTWRLGCMAPDVLDRYLDSKPIYPYPDMPSEFAAILRRCFEPDPNARWKSCRHIAQALREVYEKISGCPYFRPEPEPLRRMRKRTGGNRNGQTHWQHPDKWIQRLAAAAGPRWAMPKQWIPDRGGTFKTRALSDLEIYEDMVSLYADWIKNGHPDRMTELAELLSDKAGVHEFLDDIGGIIDQYRKSIGIRIKDRERTATPDGQLQLAAAFRGLAAAYLKQGRSKWSIKCCHTALKILDALKTVPSGDVPVPEYARIHLVLGNTHCAREEYMDALTAFETAENAMDTFGEKQTEEERLLFRSLLYRNRANALKMLHRDTEALDYLRKSLAIYDASDTCVMTDRMLRDKAATHMNLANLLSRMGYPDECLENHDKSIAIKETLIEQMGWELMAADLSLDYMNKAVSLQSLRRAEEAVELLDKALEMKREIVIYHGRHELENDLSWLYMNKAVILYQLDRKPAAVELLVKSIEIKERIYQRGSKVEMAQQLGMVYTNIGIILQDLGKAAEAVEYYDKAIKIREHLYYDKKRDELGLPLANLYSSKASMVFQQGDTSEGVRLSDRAIAILEPMTRSSRHPGPREHLAIALGNKAGGILGEYPGDPAGWKTGRRALEIMHEMVVAEKRYEKFFRLKNIWLQLINALAAQDRLDDARAEKNALLDALDRCRADAPSKDLDAQREDILRELSGIFKNHSNDQDTFN